MPWLCLASAHVFMKCLRTDGKLDQDQPMLLGNYKMNEFIPLKVFIQFVGKKKSYKEKGVVLCCIDI